MNCLSVRSALVLALLSARLVYSDAQAQVTILMQDFASANGGFTVANTGTVEGPWTFNPGLGANGDGAWFASGSANVGTPTASLLTSPTLNVTQTGSVKISFTHRYSFEYDGVRWDGGNLRVSINGRGFNPVSRLRFTAHGYDGLITGNNIVQNQYAFNNQSPGYAEGQFIESIAIIGDLNAGDTIAVQFAAGWDEFTVNTQPNWIVDAVKVEAGGPLSGAPLVDLLSFSAQWRYDDSGADLGTAWRMPGFNDSAWQSGSGVLGFPASENLLGVAPINTPLKRYISGTSGPQPITYYFRTTFSTAGISVGSLIFSNLLDDGAVFYLNGHEQFRLFMPAATAFNTESTRANDITDHGVDVMLLETADLLPGQNVLAVEVHQGGPTSSDAILGVRLQAEVPPRDSGVRPPVPLLTFGSTWRYEASGTDLGTVWKESGYNDTAWMSGPGPFGFETATLPEPIRTTLANNNELTYYFRSSFMFSDEPEDAELSLTALLDDGAVVYLNGFEVLRVGMLGGPVTFATPAARTVDNAGLESFVIPGTRLVSGLNHIAVEGHQVNRTSADFVMGLTVTAQFPPASELTITSEPADLVVEEFKAAIFSVGVSGNAARYQWYKGTSPIPGATHAIYTITNVAPADAGAYHVTVSNAFSSLISRTAQLTVIQDLTGPALLAADGTRSNTIVVATFSEPISSATATVLNNYTITNTAGGTLTISSAVLTNGTNVILTSQARLPDQNYLLVTRGLRDTSPNNNVVGVNNSAPISSFLVILGANDTWDYYDPVPGVDPPITDTRWRNFGFDPLQESWGTGPGIFVYDLNNQDLPATRGTTLSQGSVTKYFRKEFDFTGSPAGASLRLRHLTDDGLIIYLNGEELLRFNMPADPIDHMTPAAAAVGVASFIEIEVDAQRLRFGTNLLAAELHGMSGNDQDFVFGLELIARIESAAVGPIIVTRQPQSQTVLEGKPVTFSFAGVGASRFQWFRNNTMIPGATNASYTIDSVPLSFSNSTFRAALQNGTSNQTTSNAVLTVLPDLARPLLVFALAKSNQVIVAFNEPVSPSTATRLDSYAIVDTNGAPRNTILSAVLTNATNVILTTASPFLLYDVLRVYNVTDTSSATNATLPATCARIGFDGNLLNFEDIWRYDQTGNDLGMNWRESGFNDASWSSGPSLLGAETAALPVPLRTQLLPPNGGGPITDYFRARFYYPGDPTSVLLTLRLVIDDGAVFYLNGQELYRLAVPTGQNAATLASRTVGDAVLEGPVTLTAPSLIKGENVLAVEVHQSADTSSDIVFGARLNSTLFASQVENGTCGGELPEIEIRRLQDGRVSISFTPGSILVESSTVKGSYTPVSNTSNPYVFTPPAGSAKFYRACR